MLPDDIDPECRALCEAMNGLPGIRTFASCCGHDEHPFCIFFDAESLETLPLVAYWFDRCHSGVKRWEIIAHTDCGMSPISFIAKGPVGDYAGAKKVAAVIRTNLSASQTSGEDAMNKVKRLAEMFQALTYDEMMEVAECFSDWTAIDENGADQEKTIDGATMASNLSGWAVNELSK